MQAEVVSNGFFASASRKTVKRPGAQQKVHTSSWQAETWRQYDICGEFRSAVTWIANLVSKAKLEVRKDGKAVTTGPAFAALQSLYGGPEEQSDMLRLLALHMSVAGDCYLVGESSGDPSIDDEWDIVSNLKLHVSGSWFRLAGEDEDLDKNALVIRFWRKHPLDRKKGDANARAVIPVLSELETMTKRVAADSESRLVGAGVLFIPNEVTFPTPRVEEGAEGGDASITKTGLDGFMDMLIETAATAISDQSDASAKVPIVVQMPGDQIKNVKLIHFWSEYDAALKELRAEAIRRLSLGLDIPPEVLTGLADANHWTAWQMEEAAIKIHTEPLLDLIVRSLDEGYLWPMLLESGMNEDEARTYTLYADTAEMRLRPNRSQEALELYDRGELSAAAALRENGFKPEDAMSEEELLRWFQKKVASGSTTPELVARALKEIGMDIPEAQIIRVAETQEARPTPSLEEHPTRDIPERQADSVNGAVLAASEVLVLRALERAGNRLKGKGARVDGVAAAELYRFIDVPPTDVGSLLEDAWGLTDRIGTAVPTSHLEAYVRNLLVTKAEHRTEVLARFLLMAEQFAPKMEDAA